MEEQRNGQQGTQDKQGKPTAFFKRRDVWIILGVLAVAVALLFALRSAPGGDNATVVVYVGNEEYKRVPLAGEDIILVEQTGGRVNEIAIGAHGVHMSRSTCDNQDCVKQGDVNLENYADRPLGGWIVCLPNQVSIEVVTEQSGAAE